MNDYNDDCNDDDDDDDGSGLARNTDPQTSHDARPSPGKKARQCFTILQAYMKAYPEGYTRCEVGAVFGTRADGLPVFPTGTITTRVSDLKRAGFLVNTDGRRRPGDYKATQEVLYWTELAWDPSLIKDKKANPKNPLSLEVLTAGLEALDEALKPHRTHLKLSGKPMSDALRTLLIELRSEKTRLESALTNEK